MISRTVIQTIAFQSTPPARGATIYDLLKNALAEISIHAPREGGDYTRFGSLYQVDISIHAPREGGDQDVTRLIAIK